VNPTASYAEFAFDVGDGGACDGAMANQAQEGNEEGMRDTRWPAVKVGQRVPTHVGARKKGWFMAGLLLFGGSWGWLRQGLRGATSPELTSLIKKLSSKKQCTPRVYHEDEVPGNIYFII
jgi:hypothetical protein